eukprot:symbB.v1.2.024216.t1/scaffold2274.1/size83574/1
MEAAIQQIHDYLAKVDGLLDKTVYIKARAQQYEVVVQHIKARLPVDCEMAAKLIELVASGPWDADQKENIMLVINGGMSGGTSRALRPRQNCSSFSRFLTSDELALISDETKTAAAKLDVLAKRMLLIGLVSPSETTAAQATSAGLANLQINQKKRKAIEDTPGKPASPESKDVNVAKTTPAVEAVGTAEPASRSAKPLLALENQAPALENKALELPVFDSQPEDEKVSTSAGVPTDVLNALDSREKAKAKSKGAPKAKGKPKAKPKAKSGAQPKAKPGAKPKAKPGAKPKAKPEAKPQPKSLAKKRCTRESSVGGWIVEVRYRPDGQTDKHYLCQLRAEACHAERRSLQGKLAIGTVLQGHVAKLELAVGVGKL